MLQPKKSIIMKRISILLFECFDATTVNASVVIDEDAPDWPGRSNPRTLFLITTSSLALYLLNVYGWFMDHVK